MLYSWRALSAVWIIILGVFALIAAGTVTGTALWLTVAAGLVAPAIILAFDERSRKTPSPQ